MLDLARLLDGEMTEIPFSREYPLAEYSEDIREGKCEAGGVCSNHSGYIELNAWFRLSYTAVCARCGKDFTCQSEFTVKAPVAEKLENADEDEDEYFLLKDGKLDIDDVCESSIILNLPSRFLCKKDCKGLCSKCGADLNDGACSCDGKVIDPRMEKLKEYLKK